MIKYKFKVTKTFSCYGHQAERHYEIIGDWFTAKIKYFGNQGFDAPQIIRTKSGNDYFHSVNSFMREFYKDNLTHWFSNYKDGETRNFELERYF